MQKLQIDHYNRKNIYYNEHIYLFKYEPYIREKILKYKFNDKAYYYKTFAKIFTNNKKVCDILKNYDIIVPVPIHNKRRKERGYNQTELISREIVKELREKNINLEYVNALRKIKNNKPQSSLNKMERINNATNSYTAEETAKINNKRIIIFDDIYTTGSTANECAKIIRKYTKNKIGILTIAKD